MKKTILLILVVVAVLSQGCETVKGAHAGAKKDIANTGGHMASAGHYCLNAGSQAGHYIVKGFNGLMEIDRSFQEKYW
jgi:predicted small secreted protein